MKIEKQKLTLSSGETVSSEYDREGDILEIFFHRGEATCAIELTENMILRFDWEKSKPLSLSFLSYSRLLQPATYGKMHFQLLTDEWPDNAQDKIWTMLQASPLSDFLEIRSYAPAHSNKIFPMATIKQPDLLAKAA